MSDFNRPIDASGDPIARIAALLRASETAPAGDAWAAAPASDVAAAPVDVRDPGERLLALDVWAGLPAGERRLDTAQPPLSLADGGFPVDTAVERILAALN